ncbi:Concanavalin A-like lectin/glucanase, subgroup [Artemisia annua]|uniref:Concanavalin A-like lectin/glucanase, subgroup n=1 Tax=Artemisia annua TaxID=35608 RepID=A0A2U1LQR3_ARTAN|nr:Concanavalin A-like lectin/glucanase, subgroup [Artemisia annua]
MADFNMKIKARRSSTSLHMSSWIFGMVLIVLKLMAKQVAAQSGDWNNTLLRKYCRSYNAMNEVFYLRNLNSTLSSLRRQLSNPQVYYANAQSMSNDEFVYSFAMCREYLSTSKCLACFDSAVNETKACWIADGGNMIYDDCSLRYENFGQIFGDTKVILDNDATPTAVCGNELSSQPPTIFNKILQELLSDIQVATPKTANFYVASTRNVSNNNSTVYAIAQCVKNTSQSICQSCLNTAYNNLRGCLPSKDGRAIDFFCFMRYSDTSFFHSNQTTNIIPFLSQGSPREYGMIGGLSSAVGLFLLVLVLLLWYRQQKKSKTVREDESGLQGTRGYSYQELRLATRNFGEECIVGKGGFGEVFKASIDDDNVVAVKRLHVGFGRAKFEFDNEVKLIRNVQHRNLVRLLGWCMEGAELLLVFEYMAHGSLNNFLWGEKKGTLNWEKRFNIILGVARGLAHLHSEFHVKIIHRDIKSDNILLDDDFQPKIADFGLARFQPEDQTHVSTKLAGTLGYMAPDYATNGHLSEKVDTYSFGVVCLEIISGRRCTDENFSGPDTPHLLEHAWQLYEKGMHLELIDDTIRKEEHNEANVMKAIEIALMCTQSKATLRPTMSEVVSLLLSRQSMGLGQLVKPTFMDSRRVFYRSAN